MIPVIMPKMSVMGTSMEVGGRGRRYEDLDAAFAKL